MTCRSDDRGVTIDQRDRRGSSTNTEKKKCSSCNSQLCSSYIVGLLACVLIIGGVFLAFQRWDYMWLFVTLIGIILTFVGASLHYCGTRDAPKQVAQRQSSATHEVSQSEQLLSPSAPSLNGAFSASQLSLSMLPPYFPSYDTMSISGPRNGGCIGPSISPSIIAGTTGAISPIMQINGQSFLLLPISKQMSEDGTVINDAQSIVTSKTASVQMNPDPSQVLSEPSRGFIMIKPTDFQTQSSNQNLPRVSTATQSTTLVLDIEAAQQHSLSQQCESRNAENIVSQATQNSVPPNTQVSSCQNTRQTISECRPSASASQQPFCLSAQSSVSQSTQTSVNETVAIDIQTLNPVETTESSNPEIADAPFYNEIIPVLQAEPIYEVPRPLLEEETTNTNEPPTDAVVDDGAERDPAAIANAPEDLPGATDNRNNTCSQLEVPIPDVINRETLSRSTTPDRDELDLTMCPPSYDEVAVTTRLGMPKFAYETM